MMILSDGDISDIEPSKKNIQTLFSSSPHTTIDFGIINGQSAYMGMPNMYNQVAQNSASKTPSQMELTACEIKNANPKQQIGIYSGHDANEIPAGIVGLLFQKIRSFKSFTAVPWAVKRKQFQRAQRRFGLD